MSDEELIARLRGAPADGLGTENLCIAAADRIEALVPSERLLPEVGSVIRALDSVIAEMHHLRAALRGLEERG